MSESVSPQQQAILRRIKQKQSIVNEIFKQLQIKKSDVMKQNENVKGEPEQARQENNNHAYLQKYKEYSIEKIRKNYEEALPPFKWYQLPFCKKIVVDKIQFCIPANMVILATYLIWRKIGDNTARYTLKGSLKLYAGLSVVTWTAVLLESLFFQPYCDINSQHYNNKITNIELAKQLKQQYIKLYPH